MGNFDERETRRKKSVVSAIIGDNQTEAADISNMTVEFEKESIKIEPRAKEETRSKRVNLLITPSVYHQAQKKCKKLGISLNECINQFLSGWVQNQ